MWWHDDIELIGLSSLHPRGFASWSLAWVYFFSIWFMDPPRMGDKLIWDIPFMSLCGLSRLAKIILSSLVMPLISFLALCCDITHRMVNWGEMWLLSIFIISDIAHCPSLIPTTPVNDPHPLSSWLLAPSRLFEIEFRFHLQW